ncbi:hypothetical protein OOZ19_03600 [Saccharopolyspora sp. NFXS83]|nr:hypothetical protein [Saccharopolyspora sp. NFXS83]MCX2729313.1 hypothetical protein [Saccharopolyspora sp. NFXS83]
MWPRLLMYAVHGGIAVLAREAAEHPPVVFLLGLVTAQRLRR